MNVGTQPFGTVMWVLKWSLKENLCMSHLQNFDLSDSFLETTSPDPNSLFFTTEA